MASCFGLNGKPSAINQSWVCSPAWPQDKPEWADTDPCVFLFDQQLNRPSPNYCAIGETAVMTCLFAVGLLCNLFAVRNFHRKRVTPQFLALIVYLAVCNFLVTSTGLLGGFARNFDDWIYGQFGCAVIMGGRCVVFTASIWTMTLISFERRFAVLSRSPTATGGMSLSVILGLLALLTAVDVAVWSIPFGYLQVAQLQSVLVDGVKGGNETVLICAILAYKKPHRSIIEGAFTVVTFFIPITLTTVNYISIWRTVRSFSSQMRGDTAGARGCCCKGSAPSRSPSDTSDGKAAVSQFISSSSLFQARNRQREIYLAKLMSSTLVLFVLCNLPANLVVAYVSYDVESGKTVQSITFVAASWLMYLQASLSPFVQSVLRVNHDESRPSSQDEHILASVEKVNRSFDVLHQSPVRQELTVFDASHSSTATSRATNSNDGANK